MKISTSTKFDTVTSVKNLRSTFIFYDYGNMYVYAIIYYHKDSTMA